MVFQRTGVVVKSMVDVAQIRIQFCEAAIVTARREPLMCQFGRLDCFRIAPTHQERANQSQPRASCELFLTPDSVQRSECLLVMLNRILILLVCIQCLGDSAMGLCVYSGVCGCR